MHHENAIQMQLRFDENNVIGVTSVTLSRDVSESCLPITVPTFNSCVERVGSPGIIHARTPGCHPYFRRHGCMDDLTTELALIHKATWIIDVLGLFVDMISTGLCTTRHWQASG